MNDDLPHYLIRWIAEMDVYKYMLAGTFLMVLRRYLKRKKATEVQVQKAQWDYFHKN